MKLRSDYKDAFVEKHGVKLGFMSGFVKVCAICCAEFHPFGFGICKLAQCLYLLILLVGVGG